MGTEYKDVGGVREHETYVAVRNIAAWLIEAVSTGALAKLTLPELEELLDELSVMLIAKQSRAKQYGTMTAEELSQVVAGISAEIKRRKQPETKPLTVPPGTAKPFVSKNAESAAPDAGELTDVGGPIPGEWWA